jgi:DNA-binding HxlR family transcriptional regulator
MCRFLSRTRHIPPQGTGRADALNDSGRPVDEDRRAADRLVRVLAGRWTLVVLAELSTRGRRYQDLHDSVDSIAHKVLTDTLRRAERDGLIVRHLDAEHIETATLNERTDLGRSLDVPLVSRVRPLGEEQLGAGRGRSARVGSPGPAGLNPRQCGSAL